MNNNTESCINLINRIDEKKYYDLALSLSAKSESYALENLRLIMLLNDAEQLKKQFDICEVSKTFKKDEYEDKLITLYESVPGNLVFNQHGYAFALLLELAKNHPVDWDLKPCNSYMSILDFYLRSMTNINYPYDRFYHRYDMLDARLDLIEYLIDNNLLTERHLYSVKKMLMECIKNNLFGRDIIMRTKCILGKIGDMDIQIEKDNIDLRIKAREELYNFDMSLDSKNYMQNEFLILAREK